MGSPISRDESPYLSVEETAALLRTSRKAIYAMADRGRLPGVRRIGKRLLINRAVLVRSIEATSVESPPTERNGGG
jgi:excisionase family DNA binding protein